VAAGLVDKLLLFVAPELSGSGPRWLGDLPKPLQLLRLEAEPVGGDTLVTAYLRIP
jgi:riboflavin biosynthesis pyrimidine reductase